MLTSPSILLITLNSLLSWGLCRQGASFFFGTYIKKEHKTCTKFPKHFSKFCLVCGVVRIYAITATSDVAYVRRMKHKTQLNMSLPNLFHHHHCLDSPWWALVFLRNFTRSFLLRGELLNPLQCRPWQIDPVFTSLDFVTMFFIRGGFVSPTPNPQQFWRTHIFLSGLCPLADQPQLHR